MARKPADADPIPPPVPDWLAKKEADFDKNLDAHCRELRRAMPLPKPTPMSPQERADFEASCDARIEAIIKGFSQQSRRTRGGRHERTAG